MPHGRTRAPVVGYRCRECGAALSLFTGTVWAGAHYACPTVAMILRGFAQGVPTLQLADEPGCDYGELSACRHEEMQAAAPRR